MRYGIMLVILLLFGCASNNAIEAQEVRTYISNVDMSKVGPLYADFREAREVNDPEQLEVIFSHGYFKELGGFEAGEAQASIALIEAWITTEANHIERIDTVNGCLVVNGLDEYGEPGTLAIGYVLENSRWAIKSIYADGHGSEDKYYSEAICP